MFVIQTIVTLLVWHVPTTANIIYNCSNYQSHEDTYRLCKIFGNATIESTYSSFWMKNDSSPCNWGANTNYLECKHISSINETRIIKLDVEFDYGNINLSPASNYPWPEYMEYIDLSGTNTDRSYVQGIWSDYSNLPQTVYHLGLAYCSFIDGTLNFSSLPQNLDTLITEASRIDVYFNDTSLIPRNLTTLNAYSISNTIEEHLFDWQHLPETLEYLRVAMHLIGPMNLTKLPDSLYWLRMNDNSFDSLILPNPTLKPQNSSSNLQRLHLNSNKFNVSMQSLNFSYFDQLIYLHMHLNDDIYGTVDWSNFIGTNLYYLDIGSMSSLKMISNNSVSDTRLSNLKYLWIDGLDLN